MILQALVRLYDSLLSKGDIERPGWLPVQVSYGLKLDADGGLVGVAPLMHPEQRGKSTKMVPRTMNAPAPVKRSSGVNANFLCDNAAYIVGLDSKGKPERALKCFEESKTLHTAILGDVDDPMARAIVAFYGSWHPENAAEHPLLAEHMEQLLSGGNLTFFMDMDGIVFASEAPAVINAWDEHYSGTDSPEIRCLVTGEKGAVTILHPSLKGVVGGQPTGVSLVSFNAPAYESFEKQQGMNAPVSTRAAFAYGAALNYLLSSNEHRMRMGDATVVFWAEDAEAVYDDLFLTMMGNDSVVDQQDLIPIMKGLTQGHSVRIQDKLLNAENRYYVLGLSPNAGRVSVRFFLTDTFGSFIKNLLAHEERLAIVRPAYEKDTRLTPWRLMNETVNQNSRDKSPLPQLAGDFLRAILLNAPYPETLLNQTELRIRAEKKLTLGRVAIIKAYLIRNTANSAAYTEYKEVLDRMDLNEQTTYIPYLLGRLFKVLEYLQKEANPKINTTIRDRFFNSACATPAIVFPQLLNLANSHLKKLREQERNNYEEIIAEIICKIGADYPKRMSLYDQGVFQIGYYHQTQKRYEKKGVKENG